MASSVYFTFQAQLSKDTPKWIIDTIKEVYPGRTLWGYHTDTSRSLLLSNGVKNLRKELDEYPAIV